MNYAWSPGTVVASAIPMWQEAGGGIMVNSRVWITEIDDDTNEAVGLDGWYGVVDEDDGGIVAYAGTLARAQLIRKALLGEGQAVVGTDAGNG